MATPDDQWWDAQAGEYVLGTLTPSERDLFEKILASDEDARARVAFWQRQLSALDQFVEPVAPPAHVLDGILQRIEHAGLNEEREPSTSKPASSEVVSVVAWQEERHSHALQKTATMWRSVAGLATAAALIMAVVLLNSLNGLAPSSSGPGPRVLSVVQDEQRSALWVLNASSDAQLLEVVALNPPALAANQSFELWMVKPDDTGVASVGLLPTSPGDANTLTLPLPTKQAQLFAVSLEPAGGSPQSVPTGPVLYTGEFIATASRLP